MTEEEVVLFLDKIYTGEDAVFEYKGRKLWAQAYWNRKLNLNHSEVFDYTVEGQEVIMLVNIDSLGDRIKIFENAAVFDGKTFHEVKEDINWIW